MAKRKNDTSNTQKSNGPDSAGKAAAKKAPSADKKAPAKKNAQKKSAGKQDEPGFIQKTKQFFREVRIELKKVTWPSRKETIASTSVVIVLVFIIAVYLGIVDVALSKAIKMILHP